MALFDLHFKLIVTIDSPHTQAQIEDALRHGWRPLARQLGTGLVALDPTGLTTIAGHSMKVMHVNSPPVPGETDDAASPFALDLDDGLPREDVMR